MVEKQVTNIQIHPDVNDENLSLQHTLETLQTALHLHQLTKTLQSISNYSPLLNQKMLPFISSAGWANYGKSPFLAEPFCL